MSLVERIVRALVYARFGRASAEADVITDYLDHDVPDYRGAWRAYRSIRRAQ
jgi:hypothetical protein